MELAIPPVFAASAVAEAGAAVAGSVVDVDAVAGGCAAPTLPDRPGLLLVVVVAGFVAAEELAPPMFAKKDGAGAAVEAVPPGPLAAAEAAGWGKRDGVPGVEPAAPDPNKLLAGAAVEAGAVMPKVDD